VRARVADRTENMTTDASVPMRVAHYRKSVGSVLGVALTRTESAGELEAGVCAACGYTEFYAKNPSEIIVDGINVRELVATDPAGG